MQAQRDELVWLGSRYFTIIRQAVRRDLADAEAFFGLPPGQIGYLLGNLAPSQLSAVAGFGLPYHVQGQSLLLSPAALETNAAQHALDAADALTGWRRRAYEHAVAHWWVARDWARQDPRMAALLCHLSTRQEVDALAAITPGQVPALAAATYNRMHLDASIGMQTALLLADAEAAPDRVTVARCSSPIAKAA